MPCADLRKRRRTKPRPTMKPNTVRTTAMLSLIALVIAVTKSVPAPVGKIPVPNI